MGKAKQTRKFAVAKKIISPSDTRIKSVSVAAAAKQEKRKKAAEPRSVEQTSSAMFFAYNESLGPPYNVLVDTVRRPQAEGGQPGGLQPGGLDDGWTTPP